jgi:hypothetical protein
MSFKCLSDVARLSLNTLFPYSEKPMVLGYISNHGLHYDGNHYN